MTEESQSIGIVRYGAYIPKYTLSRKIIAEAWDFPSIPGSIAVKNYDEDTITMAVEAGLDCLGEFDTNTPFDPSKVDGLYFASTTAPYSEKQSAPIIATALNLRNGIDTMDITNSTRGISLAMARAISTNVQIVRGVISFIEVNMMDNFAGLELAPEFFFCDMNMLVCPHSLS